MSFDDHQKKLNDDITLTSDIIPISWQLLSNPNSKPGRLVITLTGRQRAYLEYRSRMQDKPMAEIVRQLIDEAYAADQRRFQQLTKKVAGTWTRGDGLEYQIKVREEWER